MTTTMLGWLVFGTVLVGAVVLVTVILGAIHNNDKDQD